MNRVVIITGGASGIGAGLVRSHAADGDIVLAADVDVAGLAEVGQLPGVEAVELDVRDAAAVQTVVDDAVRRHGRLDVIYNNAGIGIGGRTENLALAHWDRVIDVNLRGVVHGVHAALPHLLRQGHGQVVNTASLAGLLPAPGLAPYAATKHAVVGLTLSLNVEYAERGVVFTAVCPGFTDTPILDKDAPADLPSVPRPVNPRRIAEATPGGIYPLEKLIADIRTGVAAKEAIIVSPASARRAWRLYRWAPGRILRIFQRQASRAQQKLRGR